VKVIGFRSAKDSFGWAVVEGDSRASAVITERNVAPAPRDTREAQLAWVSREVHDLLDRFAPTGAAIQAPGGAQGGLSDAIAQRIEVDGVIRSVLGIRAIPTKSIKPQSMPKTYGTTKEEFQAVVEAVACIATTPKTHRDPVIMAVSQLPE
jgi:Holliday junction resolvasome RuvABC endonuclease subunit